MRLLDGDHRVQQALRGGELAQIAARQHVPEERIALTVSGGGER